MPFSLYTSFYLSFPRNILKNIPDIAIHIVACYMERRLEELADPSMGQCDDELSNRDWRGLADILKPAIRAPGITHKLCGVIEEK